MTSYATALQNDPNSGLRTRLERGPEDPSESISVSQEWIDLQEAVRDRLEVRMNEPRRRRRSRR